MSAGVAAHYSLGHLADSFILELGGKSLTTHGTPSDSSMLAILVSTISGEVHIGHTGYRTNKLSSGTTSEPGRYVKSLGEPVTGPGLSVGVMLSMVALVLVFMRISSAR